MAEPSFAYEYLTLRSVSSAMQDTQEHDGRCNQRIPELWHAAAMTINRDQHASGALCLSDIPDFDLPSFIQAHMHAIGSQECVHVKVRLDSGKQAKYSGV